MKLIQFSIEWSLYAYFKPRSIPSFINILMHFTICSETLSTKTQNEIITLNQFLFPFSNVLQSYGFSSIRYSPINSTMRMFTISFIIIHETPFIYTNTRRLLFYYYFTIKCYAPEKRCIFDPLMKHSPLFEFDFTNGLAFKSLMNFHENKLKNEM